MSNTGRVDSTAQSQTLHPVSPTLTVSVASIQLVDHTQPASEDNHPGEVDPDTENDALKNEISNSPLSPKLTRVSLHLREEINRRKWARYQQDRAEPSLH